MNETFDNLASHGSSRFVLSMGEVNRLDSSGIGLLVRMLERSKKAGGTVKLVRPSNAVSATLRMCCVLPLFEVFAEEGEAIASFART
jgi:anti-sigma B factor antagonist